MMKRYLSAILLLLLLLLIFPFSACTPQEEESTEGSLPPQSEESTDQTMPYQSEESTESSDNFEDYRIKRHLKYEEIGYFPSIYIFYEDLAFLGVFEFFSLDQTTNEEFEYGFKAEDVYITLRFTVGATAEANIQRHQQYLNDPDTIHATEVPKFVDGHHRDKYVAYNDIVYIYNGNKVRSIGVATNEFHLSMSVSRTDRRTEPAYYPGTEENIVTALQNGDREKFLSLIEPMLHYSEIYHGMDEYEEFVEAGNLPEGFIPYEVFSSLGTLKELRFPVPLAEREDHNSAWASQYSYLLANEYDISFLVTIYPESDYGGMEEYVYALQQEGQEIIALETPPPRKSNDTHLLSGNILYKYTRYDFLDRAETFLRDGTFITVTFSDRAWRYYVELAVKDDFIAWFLTGDYERMNTFFDTATE